MKPKQLWVFIILAIPLIFGYTSGKVFEKCEFAKELKYVHRVSPRHLGILVCIVHYSSRYNTSAIGTSEKNGSKDYGIFQINNKEWCSPPGKTCGIPCTNLLDDDIEDDVKCVEKIYKTKKSIFRNSFRTWPAYRKHCTGIRGRVFAQQCF